MVIANKFVSEPDAVIRQYRISLELPYPEHGLTVNTSVPQRFYDVAKTGDTIRSPFHGYLVLVRENKVIARHFTDDLIVPGVMFFVSLIPITAFLKLERIRFGAFCMAVLTFIECLMIGLFFFLLFQ